MRCNQALPSGIRDGGLDRTACDGRVGRLGCPPRERAWRGRRQCVRQDGNAFVGRNPNATRAVPPLRATREPSRLDAEIDALKRRNEELTRKLLTQQRRQRREEGTLQVGSDPGEQKGPTTSGGEDEGDPPLDVVFVSAEVAPWSKTGGLGDVAAALPSALAARSHRVTVVSPLYQFVRNRYCSSVDDGEHALRLYGTEDGDATHAFDMASCGRQTVRYWIAEAAPGDAEYVFVEHGAYDREGGPYGDGSGHGEPFVDNAFRFALLSLAACELVAFRTARSPPTPSLPPSPPLFLANDWHAAMVPVFLRARYGAGGPPPSGGIPRRTTGERGEGEREGEREGESGNGGLGEGREERGEGRGEGEEGRGYGLLAGARCVLVIHNLQHQGIFPLEHIPMTGLTEADLVEGAGIMPWGEGAADAAKAWDDATPSPFPSPFSSPFPSPPLSPSPSLSPSASLSPFPSPFSSPFLDALEEREGEGGVDGNFQAMGRCLNMLGAGVFSADRIVTVSPSYAWEILERDALGACDGGAMRQLLRVSEMPSLPPLSFPSPPFPPLPSLPSPSLPPFPPSPPSFPTLSSLPSPHPSFHHKRVTRKPDLMS